MTVRTREKGYIDYGFESGEEKKIMNYCSDGHFSEHDILLQAAVSANPCIASDLYYSIVNGVSYEAIEKIKQIPLSKSDFYGYRRKCLGIFKKHSLLYGK